MESDAQLYAGLNLPIHGAWVHGFPGVIQERKDETQTGIFGVHIGCGHSHRRVRRSRTGGKDIASSRIDDFGLTTSVPEPSSRALTIVGVGVVGATLRRRRAVAT